MGLVLPDLVLLTRHLDGPGRGQPGEPVHRDLMEVLVELYPGLGPTHPGLTVDVRITIVLEKFPASRSHPATA